MKKVPLYVSIPVGVVFVVTGLVMAYIGLGAVMGGNFTYSTGNKA